MNDDYLWDKTGQPDPQIQQLEEILGALRYQPKPLVLPRRKNYFPLLAIAASILLAIVAGGIWLRVRSRNVAPTQQAQVKTPSPQLPETPKPAQNRSAVNPPAVVARNNPHRKRSAASAVNREEALVAKEQLMLALRITSEKLSLVHRKTQPNQIKNQHRIG
jgi:hypothetical protein